MQEALKTVKVQEEQLKVQEARLKEQEVKLSTFDLEGPITGWRRGRRG